MPKDIILDIATGIVVLGSIFGVSHLRKLETWIRKSLGSDKNLPKTSE